MKFRTELLQAGTTATGIAVPADIVEAFGNGKRPPVCITINGHTYRSTVAVMGGRFMVGLSAENRAAAGVAGGDMIDVDIEFDTEPREVQVPADLTEALAGHPRAEAAFAALAYSHRKEWVRSIEDAKTPETRQRRIDKAVSSLGG